MGYYTGDYYAGDPGLPLLGAGAALATRALPALRSIAGKALPALRTLGGVALGGAAFEAGQRLVSGAAEAVEGRGERRRYRRMNPLNISAARRAIRRLKSAERTMRGIYTFVRPRPGKSHFKLGRKRRS